MRPAWPALPIIEMVIPDEHPPGFAIAADLPDSVLHLKTWHSWEIFLAAVFGLPIAEGPDLELYRR